MKKIKLSQDKYAMVDNSDYELLSQWKWCYGNNGYAVRFENIDGKRKSFLMHRQILNILGSGYKKITDHKNGNRLDNRRNNLRVCTTSLNMMNTNVRSTNTSGFKGVYFHKQAKKWMAYINKDGIRYHLGLFVSKDKAAEAYNTKAKELFGDYIKLNNIQYE